MRLVVAALGLAITGCSPWNGGAAFHCDTDTQCTGPGGGHCEADGFCSFADPSCSTGQRYGTSSGPQSNMCAGGGFEIDAAPGDDASDGDTDAPDGPPASMCFGTPLRVCLTALPTTPYAAPGSINTDSGCTQVVAQQTGPELCVLAGTSVTVPGATRITGARPLVLVATDTLSVAGTLDASSTAGGAGAAANSAACGVAGNGANDTGGGAGGAGGSFGGKGGDGGRGDENGGVGGQAAGGVGTPAEMPAIVHGGCKGGNGGTAGGTPGAGASGGGAIYLIAATSITIPSSGGVFASGAGGAPGLNCDGGGGGGSGGMLGFDAPTISIMGKVAANGGGGGGGGGSGTNGSPGTDGTTTAYNTRALGGAATGNGGGGGNGGALGNVPGSPGVNADCGGGAGGGAAGFVWTHGTVTGTQISPAATPK